VHLFSFCLQAGDAGTLYSLVLATADPSHLSCMLFWILFFLLHFAPTAVPPSHAWQFPEMFSKLWCFWIWSRVM